MKAWETWRYLTGLHHLQSHTPGDPVHFIDEDGDRIAAIKEWRGIVSSIVDRGRKHYRCTIQFKGAPDILICEMWNDKNPQIIIETLTEYMANPIYKLLRNHK